MINKLLPVAYTADNSFAIPKIRTVIGAPHIFCNNRKLNSVGRNRERYLRLFIVTVYDSLKFTVKKHISTVTDGHIQRRFFFRTLYKCFIHNVTVSLTEFFHLYR